MINPARLFSGTVFLIIVNFSLSGASLAGKAEPLLGISADGEACLLGGAVDGRIAGPEILKPLMRHGELYQLRNMGKQLGIAPAIGTPRDESGEGGDCSGMWLQEMALDPLRKKQSSIALRLGKTRKTIPVFPVKRLDMNLPEYRGLLHTYLIRKGIKKPVIHITQAFGADFDGDGREDVLINAVRSRRAMARRGDYSIILLILAKSGPLHPLVIQDEITMKDSRFPGDLWVNVIVAIVDINGDGKPEIVLEGQSEFGGGWEVIGLKDGKIEHMFFCGCEG